MLKRISLLLLVTCSNYGFANQAPPTSDAPSLNPEQSALPIQKCIAPYADPNTKNQGPSFDLVGGSTDLRIVKSHTGSFSAGQIGALYSISVDNLGVSPSSGTVTVTDILPAGLTASSIIGGCGWSCTLGTLTCTRSDALAGGTAYPSITLVVNVSPTAPASVINTATVSGGGDSDATNNASADTTIITGGVPTPAVSLPIDARWALILLGLLLLFMARTRLFRD